MTQEGKRPVTPRKESLAQWFPPQTRATLQKARPYGPEGATVYVRPGNWRPAEGIDPDFPPFTARYPLRYRRNVGNATSEDRTYLGPRGFRFHASVDEAELAIETFVSEPGFPGAFDEWDLFLETGFYDGPPVPVWQHLQFYPTDYLSGNPDIVEESRRLADYTVEFRARAYGQAEPTSSGNLLFFSAGTTPDVDQNTDPLILTLSIVPVSAVEDWTPLNPFARYVAFAADNSDESFCIFQARG